MARLGRKAHHARQIGQPIGDLSQLLSASPTAGTSTKHAAPAMYAILTSLQCHRMHAHALAHRARGPLRARL
eukprot:12983756-Alexandrium_andersonii.AAC.1